MVLTGHDAPIGQVYTAAFELGWGTIREGISRSRVEIAPFQYDWSHVQRNDVDAVPKVYGLQAQALSFAP